MKLRTKKVVAPHEPERLTSSERSQIRRKAIYADPLLHQALKDADALHKRLKSNEGAASREKDPVLREAYRAKERAKKRKQRATK